MSNKLITNNELMKEWDYNKNVNIDPRDITNGSHKKVWWICSSCGYEWEAIIYNRTSGKGCPICSKKKQGQSKKNNIILKKGSLVDNYPNLLKEWDFDKNIIIPSELTINSKQKVWWRCLKCNYSWMTTIYHRTIRGSKCPACMNKVTTKNNCLSVTYPQILEKWNYSKNIDITPDDVTKGSNKKVWWLCPKGHEWEATISAIVNGSQCPICCGQKVLVGYNDLQSVNPKLAQEWHPQKNNIMPTEITTGSSRIKVWWLCPKGHEYQATVSNRSNGTGCPICDKELKTSFPEQAIYFYLKQYTEAINRYLLNGKTEIDIYLPKLKIGIEYDGEYFHAGKKATEKENKKDSILKLNGITLIRVKELKKDVNHSNDSIIYCKYDSAYKFIEKLIQDICDTIFKISGIKYYIDVNIQRDSSKIYSEYIESEKENSLLIKNPSLSKEWHPTLNRYIKPDMVSYSSGKKVWWICSNGHEWQASIQNRYKGNGCPICSGHKVLTNFNDLGSTHPHLIKEWNKDKNFDISYTEVTKGSHKKVWWICSKGHDYQCTISNRVHGKGCPICSSEKRIKHKRENLILKKGSFVDNNPYLLKEWNFDKNNVNPYDYSRGSDLKAWWICPKGHSYECTISNRVYGKGCPICVSKKIVYGINDLFTINSKLANEWDYEKNILNPKGISPNSHKKAWWICSACGNKWEAEIKSRNRGTGCPKCSRKKKHE